MSQAEPLKPVAFPDHERRGSDVAGPALAMPDIGAAAAAAAAAGSASPIPVMSYFIPRDLVVTKSSESAKGSGSDPAPMEGVSAGALKRPAEGPELLIQDPVFEVADAKKNVDAIRGLVAEYLAQGPRAIPPETKYCSLFHQIDLSGLQKANDRDNKVPPLLTEIQELLPAICSNSLTQMKPLLRRLTDKHRHSIEVINYSLKRGSHGLLQYYPFPIHIFYEYGTKYCLKSAAYLVEFHRRILELENKLSEMANFLYHFCKSPKLRLIKQIPELAMNRILVVFKMGTGTMGCGEDFFKPCNFVKQMFVDSLAQFDPARLSPADKKVYDTAAWLAENRQNCMTRVSLAYTGHCLSIVPGILVVASAAEDFFNLNDPEVANRLADQLETIRREMQALCKAEVNPLIRYGARLTAYYKDVYEVITMLTGVPTAINISVPFGVSLTNIRLQNNQEVHIIDPLNVSVPGNHLNYVAAGHFYLIPFHESYKDREMLTMEDRKAAAERYHAWRSRVIGNYLSTFFPGVESLPTLDLMEAGDREVLRWFNEDSHKSKLTHSLFPTPSDMKARQVNGRAFGLV